MKIKVAIVDNDAERLGRLSDFLKQQDDLCIAGTAASRETALRLAAIVEVDIILMDINLSGNRYDGIYCAAEISMFSKAKVIILTGPKGEDTNIHSFTAGAINCILKENFLEITDTIRGIHHGGSPTKVLARSLTKLQHNKLLDVLTPSEKEVFAYISNGYKIPPVTEKQFKTLA